MNLSFEEIERITPKRSKFRPKDTTPPSFVSPSGWETVPFYILLALIMTVLLSRAFYLQIIKGEENLALSKGNSIRYSFLRAPRGVIFDRNGNIIARNKPAFSVDLNTTQCRPSCKDIVTEISKLITLDLAYVEEQLSKGSNQITIATNLSRDDILKVEGKLANLTGVTTQVDPVRDYIYGESFAHVLGFVGDGEDFDKIGKSGLEKSYEKALHGTSGSKIIQINSSGTYYTQIAEKAPITGKSIYLNIDKGLQEASFNALKNAVEKKRVLENKATNSSNSNSKSTGGAVIATDPKTGGILALVSYPAFDPNLFTGGISSKDFARLNNDPNKPFFDRTISAVYPPGSTFKMVTALTALDLGIITKDSLVDCPSHISVGSYVFRDWYSGGRGPINVEEALQHSCDTFFYTVGGGYGEQKGVGIDKLSEMARKFGFGSKLGIDIDGEVSGIFPDPVWKKDAKGEDWYLGDTYITSIGQGNILATPLQVNAMTQFFATRGKIYKPRIVKSVEGEANKGPELLINDTSHGDAINTIREGMNAVVEAGGTAYPLFDFEQRHPGIRLAGKTGTAEFGNPVETGSSDTHAWFTVFGPYEEPNIVLTVFLEGGGGGSADAAPVAKEILDAWFK